MGDVVVNYLSSNKKCKNSNKKNEGKSFHPRTVSVVKVAPSTVYRIEEEWWQENLQLGESPTML